MRLLKHFKIIFPHPEKKEKQAEKIMEKPQAAAACGAAAAPALCMTVFAAGFWTPARWTGEGPCPLAGGLRLPIEEWGVSSVPPNAA